MIGRSAALCQARCAIGSDEEEISGRICWLAIHEGIPVEEAEDGKETTMFRQRGAMADE
jgi:hypothetical protein